MKSLDRISKAVAAMTLVALACSGCSTVPGTAISPITGGVDLTRFNMDRGGSLLAVPFVFIGGAVSGPFVALWNGINLDGRWAFAKETRPEYWKKYPQTFRPFEMIDLQN